MTSKFKIKGKRVLVTGAARGIGAAVARRLHEQGAKVALVGLEVLQLERIANELGEGAIYFEADVSDKAAIESAVDQVVGSFGGLDVVIANAGIYHVSPLSGVAPEGIERTLNVNLFGVWNTLYSCLPHLRESKGYVLTVASMAALTHGPLMGAYAASKAAVEALTDSLRIELSAEGVGVGCAYFGAIDTDLVKGGKMHPALSKMELMVPDFVRKPAPLSDAVDVIERGIQRRSSRMWAPRWLGAVLLLRGVAQPLLEWKLAGDYRLKNALAISYQEASSVSSKDSALGVAVLASENKEAFLIK